jgi:hypothetical protein
MQALSASVFTLEEGPDDDDPLLELLLGFEPQPVSSRAAAAPTAAILVA